MNLQQLKGDKIIQDEGQVLSHVSRVTWQHAPDSTRGARARGHALKTQGEAGVKISLIQVQFKLKSKFKFKLKFKKSENISSRDYVQKNLKISRLETMYRKI